MAVSARTPERGDKPVARLDAARSGIESARVHGVFRAMSSTPRAIQNLAETLAMFTRKVAFPLAAIIMLAAGAQALAAKPIQTTLLPITLFNITAEGEVDNVIPGPPAIALAEVYYRRGDVEMEVEARGDVENLSGARFKTTNPEDLALIFFPGPDVEITKFSYTVSRSGKAVLKFTATGTVFLPPLP